MIRKVLSDHEADESTNHLTHGVAGGALNARDPNKNSKKPYDRSG